MIAPGPVRAVYGVEMIAAGQFACRLPDGEAQPEATFHDPDQCRQRRVAGPWRWWRRWRAVWSGIARGRGRARSDSRPPPGCAAGATRRRPGYRGRLGHPGAPAPVPAHRLDQPAQRSVAAGTGRARSRAGLQHHQRRQSPWRWRFQGKPSVDGFGPLEAIIALRPDLVLINVFGSDARLEKLREAGITMFDLGELRGLSTLLPMAEIIGELLGDGERGRRFADSFQQRFAPGGRPAGQSPAAQGDLPGGDRQQHLRRHPRHQLPRRVDPRRPGRRRRPALPGLAAVPGRGDRRPGSRTGGDQGRDGRSRVRPPGPARTSASAGSPAASSPCRPDWSTIPAWRCWTPPSCCSPRPIPTWPRNPGADYQWVAAVSAAQNTGKRREAHRTGRGPASVGGNTCQTRWAFHSDSTWKLHARLNQCSGR